MAFYLLFKRSDLFQLTSTSPELFQHNPLSMLSDLFISFCISKLTFNGPLRTLCHALIGSILLQGFYHFLLSTYRIVNQEFALVYFIFCGQIYGWLPNTDSASTQRPPSWWWSLLNYSNFRKWLWQYN